LEGKPAAVWALVANERNLTVFGSTPVPSANLGTCIVSWANGWL